MSVSQVGPTDVLVIQTDAQTHACTFRERDAEKQRDRETERRRDIPRQRHREAERYIERLR